MMAILAIGGLITIAADVWIVVKAFQKSVGWGIGSLCVPFVGLVFIFMNWSEMKNPFFLLLAGCAISGVGQTLMMRQAQSQYDENMRMMQTNTTTP